MVYMICLCKITGTILFTQPKLLPPIPLWQQSHKLSECVAISYTLGQSEEMDKKLYAYMRNLKEFYNEKN